MLEDFNWGKHEGRVENVSFRGSYVHADIDGVPSDIMVSASRMRRVENGEMSWDAAAIATVKGYLKVASDMTLGMYNTTQGDKRPVYPDPVLIGGDLIWKCVEGENPLEMDDDYVDFEARIFQEALYGSNGPKIGIYRLPVTDKNIEDLQAGRISLDAVARNSYTDAQNSQLSGESWDYGVAQNIRLEGSYIRADIDGVPTRLYIPEPSALGENAQGLSQEQLAEKILDSYAESRADMTSNNFNQRMGDPTAQQSENVRETQLEPISIVEVNDIGKSLKIVSGAFFKGDQFTGKSNSLDAVKADALLNFRVQAHLYPGLTPSDYNALALKKWAGSGKTALFSQDPNFFKNEDGEEVSVFNADSDSENFKKGFSVDLSSTFSAERVSGAKVDLDRLVFNGIVDGRPVSIPLTQKDIETPTLESCAASAISRYIQIQEAHDMENAMADNCTKNLVHDPIFDDLVKEVGPVGRMFEFADSEIASTPPIPSSLAANPTIAEFNIPTSKLNEDRVDDVVFNGRSLFLKVDGVPTVLSLSQTERADIILLRKSVEETAKDVVADYLDKARYLSSADYNKRTEYNSDTKRTYTLNGDHAAVSDSNRAFELYIRKNLRDEAMARKITTDAAVAKTMDSYLEYLEKNGVKSEDSLDPAKAGEFNRANKAADDNAKAQGLIKDPSAMLFSNFENISREVENNGLHR